MTDDDTRPPPARWFRLGAWASLAWMILGVVNYLLQVTLDPATLPADQQALRAAVPGWMMAFFALAVWIGLAGALMLVLRRKAAELLLLAALVACAVQFSAYFLHAPLREQVPGDGLVVPAVILAVTWTVFWFARHSRQKGWLK